MSTRYYAKPLGAYHAEIKKALPLRDPIALTSFRVASWGRRRIQGPQFLTQVGSNGISFADADISHIAQEWLLPPGGPPIDVLAFLRQCRGNTMFSSDDVPSLPILLLPKPVCDLVVRSAWHELLLLGRWGRLPQWTAWPPDEWLHKTCGLHHLPKGDDDDEDSKPLCGAEMLSLARDLHTCYPCILENRRRRWR